MNNLEQLMTLPELAELTQRSEGSLRRDLAAGRGPRVVRIGNSIRFNPADVQDWLTDQTEEVLKCSD